MADGGYFKYSKIASEFVDIVNWCC